MIRPVAIVGLVMLAACSRPAPQPRDGQQKPTTHGSLDPAHAPAGAAAQYGRLQWERTGEWRSVDVATHAGAHDVLLVSRDPFGDRIIARRGRGYAIWRGHIDCPAGTTHMTEGALFQPDAKRPSPAGPFIVQMDPRQRHDLCATDTPAVTGPPAAVASGARAGFDHPRLDPELFRRMDAEAAARRR